MIWNICCSLSHVPCRLGLTVWTYLFSVHNMFHIPRDSSSSVFCHMSNTKTIYMGGGDQSASKCWLQLPVPCRGSRESLLWTGTDQITWIVQEHTGNAEVMTLALSAVGPYILRVTAHAAWRLPFVRVHDSCWHTHTRSSPLLWLSSCKRIGFQRLAMCE